MLFLFLILSAKRMHLSQTRIRGWGLVVPTLLLVYSICI
nr:MAG TPA: hypothetical protein [Caudoviricetes sp.]